MHIDGRMLYSSGIGRCLREILAEIVSIDKDLVIYLYCSLPDYRKYLDEYSINTGRLYYRKYESRIYSFREQITGSFLNLKIRKSDIFYFPHYNLPFVVHKNSIITVHDFIQFKFTEYFGNFKVRVAKLILNNAARKARKIILVSKSTYNDFCEYFPGYEDKALVIYNGISEKFKTLREEEKENFYRKTGLDKYLLFIGNNKPHKNISGLINSYVEIKERFPEYKLVIISRGFEKERMPGGITVIDDVPDDELVYYYNCASMLVMPSFYEGFGLPAAEAMACGCPVIASNISSLPEICGEAGILIDPYNKSSLTEAIGRLITDKNLKQTLVDRGIGRAKLFNWRISAQKYLEVFKNITGE